MKWTFDNQGGWEADSTLKDSDGRKLSWIIIVDSDGQFVSMTRGGERITVRNKSGTMEAAKAYCEHEERLNNPLRLHEADSPGTVVSLGDGLSAWFSKMNDQQVQSDSGEVDFD